jgi:hypothetical protein
MVAYAAVEREGAMAEKMEWRENEEAANLGGLRCVLDRVED